MNITKAAKNVIFYISFLGIPLARDTSKGEIHEKHHKPKHISLNNNFKFKASVVQQITPPAPLPLCSAYS